MRFFIIFGQRLVLNLIHEHIFQIRENHFANQTHALIATATKLFVCEYILWQKSR